MTQAGEVFLLQHSLPVCFGERPCELKIICEGDGSIRDLKRFLSFKCLTWIKGKEDFQRQVHEFLSSFNEVSLAQSGKAFSGHRRLEAAM